MQASSVNLSEIDDQITKRRRFKILLIKLRHCRSTAHCEIIVNRVWSHKYLNLSEICWRLNDETARVENVTPDIRALSSWLPFNTILI